MQRFDSGPKPVYLLNWLEVLKAQIETIETSAGPELFILKRLKLFPFFKSCETVKKTCNISAGQLFNLLTLLQAQNFLRLFKLSTL